MFEYFLMSVASGILMSGVSRALLNARVVVPTSMQFSAQRFIAGNEVNTVIHHELLLFLIQTILRDDPGVSQGYLVHTGVKVFCNYNWLIFEENTLSLDSRETTSTCRMSNYLQLRRQRINT